jgi:Mrp family chromosome partitioning ATPase
MPAVRLVRRAALFWRAGLLAFAAGLAVAVAAVWLWPKQYRSEAVLYYREGLQWTEEGGAGTRRVAQRLKDMLLARAQLAKVVADLGLYPHLVQAGRMSEAVEEMLLAVTFRSEGETFVISYTGRSPEEAQRTTAKLTEVLIGMNRRLRTGQAEVASEFLESEKRRNEAELAAKEAEQLRFLSKHPEFAHEQGTAVGARLRARRNAAPPRGGGALGALIREEERLRLQISSPGQVPPEPALVGARDEAAAKLRAAQRELADRRARFTEEHPDVRAAAAAVAEAEASFRRAAEALAAREAPPSPAALQERLARVQREIAAHQAGRPSGKAPPASHAEDSDAAKQIVALETEWTRLSREVAEARERLQQLDARQFTASMAASLATSGQTAQIIVVDPAFLPAHPVGPSRTRKALLCLIVALVLAIGAPVLIALLDDRIHDHFDVERLELAPVLSEVAERDLRRVEGGRRAGKRKEKGKRRSGGTEPSTSLTVAGGVSAGSVVKARAEPALASAAEGSPAAAMSVFSGVGAETYTLVEMARHDSSSVEGELLDLVERIRVHRVSSTPPSDSPLPLLTAPDSAAAASFRVLRHRLGSRKGLKVIVVTSPCPAEGKSLCAVNLALALGEGGRARVLLLEANYRSPSLARLLGFEPPVCVSEQLELHRAEPTEPWTVVESVAPWLHTAAVAPTETLPTLRGPAFTQGIREMRRNGYAYIVVDGPEILGNADVNLLEESADGILVTLRAGRSRSRDLRRAVEQVGRGKVLGVMLLGS